MQSIDLTETYVYGMSKDLVSEKEEIKYNNIIKNTKIINFNNVTNENKTEHNPNWPYIPGYSYRILIIGGSGTEKANALLNLIKNKPDIDEIIYMQKTHTKQNINT